MKIREQMENLLNENTPLKKLAVEKTKGQLVLNVNGYRYALSHQEAKTLISMLKRQLKD